MTDLEEARILRLQPGDILVFEFDRRIPMDVYSRLKEKVSDLAPGHKILVCDGGSTLRVLREGDDE